MSFTSVKYDVKYAEKICRDRGSNPGPWLNQSHALTNCAISTDETVFPNNFKMDLFPFFWFL